MPQIKYTLKNTQFFGLRFYTAVLWLNGNKTNELIGFQKNTREASKELWRRINAPIKSPYTVENKPFNLLLFKA